MLAQNQTERLKEIRAFASHPNDSPEQRLIGIALANQLELAYLNATQQTPEDELETQPLKKIRVLNYLSQSLVFIFAFVYSFVDLIGRFEWYIQWHL